MLFYLLSRECLNLSCLLKPSVADRVCCVGNMSATCLWSCRRLGDIACRLEYLNDTTFDDMSPTLCTTEVHDCFVSGDFRPRHHGVEPCRFISWAMVDRRPRPSTSPWPLHHGRRGDVLGWRRPSTTAWEISLIWGWLFVCIILLENQ